VAAAGYRGCNEVDGRSPVERAAATFVPTCVDAVRAANESAVQLSAAVGSFNAKRPDGKIPSSSFVILTGYQHFIRARNERNIIGADANPPCPAIRENG
jgi:hypothetical protein